MSRIPLPFAVADISALARALRRHLDGAERLPSHLEMLNLLAKAAGFRNFQHFRAEVAPRAGQSAPEIPAAAPAGTAPPAPAAAAAATAPETASAAASARTPQAAPAAAARETAPTAAPDPAPQPVDPRLVPRLLRLYDAKGRLLRWPKKTLPRQTCLWVLWSRLPAREVLTEREVSDRLAEMHTFGDYAFLRRQLVDNGLVTRTPDGREYRRVEARPSPEALALLERLRG